MIPPFDPVTGALPPGIHEATWAEVVERFGYNEDRRGLLVGMQEALRSLVHAGCRRVYLGGSFVMSKPDPNDWDGAWERAGVQFPRLEKAIARENVLLMKAYYGGELFDADAVAFTGETFRIFFQHDRELRPVGLVALDPASIMQEGKQ